MLHHRKRAAGRGINSNGWMISYADMVTILLAMFIVLSTLSKDQTGLSLYYGTGSYRKAVKQFGLPGVSNNSRKTVPLDQPGPRYNVDNPNGSAKSNGNTDRVIDGEEEVFQQFLQETKKDLKVKNEGKEAGRSSVDFHSRLNSTHPMLSTKQHDMIIPLVLMARQKGYRVEIVVWCPTPADTACLRAIKTASQLRDELMSDLAPADVAADRIVAVAQPWRFKDVRRPVFSVVISRMVAVKKRS